MKGDYRRRVPRQRFAAVRMNLSVPPSNVEAIITKKDEYNNMFIIEGTVIPDQLKFCTGLLHLQGKSDGVRLWPPVYNLDVSNYFLTSRTHALPQNTPMRIKLERCMNTFHQTG